MADWQAAKIKPKLKLDKITSKDSITSQRKLPEQSFMIELKKQGCFKKYINENYKTKFQLKLSVSAPPLMLESVLKGHE